MLEKITNVGLFEIISSVTFAIHFSQFLLNFKETYGHDDFVMNLNLAKLVRETASSAGTHWAAWLSPTR